jgi:hypothetical protein
VASDTAEHAIEDQLETIRLHLASSTLTDDISSSPSTDVPGGRMWTYASRGSHPDTVAISTTYSPSRRDLILNLLSQLSEIESSVNALSQTVNSELQRLDAPLFVNFSSFRLCGGTLTGKTITLEVESSDTLTSCLWIWVVEMNELEGLFFEHVLVRPTLRCCRATSCSR